MDTTLQGNSIDKSCRCCGNNFETNQLSSLFEYSNVAEMEIYRIVLNIAAISIFKNDGYSQVVCSECINQAINAYKFQQMCLSNDDCLRMSRKPLLNNEHDYSLYMTDYDMDLSEYLMVDTDHETTVEDLPKPNHEIKSNSQSAAEEDDHHDESSSEPNLPENQPPAPNIDETQNYDFSSLPKKSHRYTCPVCKKLWPTPSKLKRHLKTHTSKTFKIQPDPEPINEPKPIVQCPICFVALSSQTKLSDHMTRHKTEKNAADGVNEKSNVTFDCSVCDEKFNTPKKLRNHVNTQHMRKFSIVAANDKEDSICPEKLKSKTTQVDRLCNTCGKSFDCPSKLHRHLPVHQRFRGPPKRKPLPKRHPCQKCDKKFETPSKLQRHEVIHLKFIPIHDSMNSQIIEIMKS